MGLVLGAAAGPSGLAGMGAGILASIPIARWASRKIGGLTGDVLGATQIVSELGFLLAFVAMGTGWW
jgi:adenosylcobinamide-GDP ribazoletransferase